MYAGRVMRGPMGSTGVAGAGLGACYRQMQGRNLHTMTADSSSERKPVAGSDKEAKQEAKDRPDWTNGLRRLYDSVVEEDLPDSFRDLLSQLDTKD